MDRYVKQIVDDVMEMAAKIKFLEAKVAAAESWNAEQLADAQATVEALQARVQQLDRTLADVYAQRDGLQRELESANALLYKKNCAIGKAETTIEALQRERDEAKASRDMWKREAYLIGDALRPLCGLSEYEFGWKLAVKLIADKLAALTPAGGGRNDGITEESTVL